MYKRIPFALLLTVVALGVAISIPATSDAAKHCVNLESTKKVRKALKKAHKRLTHSSSWRGPRKGSVYYGRCGSTHYALASFKDPKFGYQDQPERFRRLKHHGWKDKGDTGGDGCGGPTPRKLLHIWGFYQC
jgi:hypothetical protein